MALDIFCVLVIVFLTVTGYFAGIVRQILYIVCLIGAFILARPATPYVGAFLASQTQMSPATCYVCSCFLAWLVVYIILRLVAHSINRAIGKDRVGQVRPWNKKLGALLGGAKGLVLVFVILCFLDVAFGVAKSRGMGGQLEKMYARSYSAAIAARISPFTRWRMEDRIDTLIEAARNPQSLKGIENEAEVRRILSHPKVLAVARSRKLDAAWKKRDIAAIMANKDFRALISDPKIASMLLDASLFDALERRVNKSRTAPPKS